jgi:hypothetical protein
MNNGQAGLVMALAWMIAIFLASRWVILAKAGQPGWAGLIPVYHWHIEFKITGRSRWWDVALWLFYPLVLVVWVLHNLDLARTYRRSWLFGVGMVVMPFIFYPILAFGRSRYAGPGGDGPCVIQGENPFQRRETALE